MTIVKREHKLITNPDAMEVSTCTLDVSEPDHIEVQIRADGKVAWIHVNGVTLLRISRIKQLVLNDERPK